MSTILRQSDLFDLLAEDERPWLLDAFCCTGGAAKGYQDAGFRVVGVDVKPQPNYIGDAFVQTDGVWAIRVIGPNVSAIHASPPCQSYTPLGALHPHKTYPDLVAATRDALLELTTPWVIENVMAAPLSKTRSIRLCGGMFGLRTYRHRRFEHSPDFPLTEPAHPDHIIRTATKRRRELWDQGWHVSITGDVGTYVGPEAMGIDWMNGNELCEAIPPAYAQYVGEQLMAHIAAEKAA